MNIHRLLHFSCVPACPLQYSSGDYKNSYVNIDWIFKKIMCFCAACGRRICNIRFKVFKATSREQQKKKKKRRVADICRFWLDGSAVNSLKRRMCNPETAAEHTNTQTTASAYSLTSYKKKKKNCQQPKDWCCICWEHGIKNGRISVQDLQKRPKWLPFICN